MIIINKKRNGMINMDDLTKIFVIADKPNIFGLIDKQREILDFYDTSEEAKTAMMMLCDRVAVAKGQGVVLFPTDAEVKVRMREMEKSERCNSSHKSGIRRGGS